MIVSRGRRYIFVHIPKTGGTSMALALEDRAMKDDIMLGDTPKARNRRRRVRDTQTRGRLWKHSTLADIDGLVSLSEIAGMFVFTMVRNPWDRAVSYHTWLRTQSFDHPAVRLAKALPFDGFLRDPAIQTSLTAWPAARYVTDARGTERCQAFIRLEHFPIDVAPLVAHLGFDLALPHLNASERQGSYASQYTVTTRDIVARCCAVDIARFGYSFD